MHSTSNSSQALSHAAPQIPPISMAPLTAAQSGGQENIDTPLLPCFIRGGSISPTGQITLPQFTLLSVRQRADAVFSKALGAFVRRDFIEGNMFNMDLFNQNIADDLVKKLRRIAFFAFDYFRDYCFVRAIFISQFLRLMGIPLANLCHLTITSTADLSQKNQDTLVASYANPTTTFNYHIATAIFFRNQYYLIDPVINNEASDDHKTWACKMMPASSIHKPCWLPQPLFESKIIPISKEPLLIQTLSDTYSIGICNSRTVFEYQFPFSFRGGMQKTYSLSFCQLGKKGDLFSELISLAQLLAYAGRCLEQEALSPAPIPNTTDPNFFLKF